MTLLKQLLNKIKALFKNFIKQFRTNIPFAISFSVFLVAFVAFIVIFARDIAYEKDTIDSNSELADLIHNAELSATPLLSPSVTGTQTPDKTPTLEPEASPAPTNSPEPSSLPDITFTPELTNTPGITNTPEATAVPAITNTPEATAVPAITNTPEATVAPEVTNTPGATNTPKPAVTPAPNTTPVMTAGGAAAYKANNDYVGWLTLQGRYTGGGDSEKYPLDYPVFQTFDDLSTPDVNESWFYLTHNAKKKYNENGSIFVDERCQVGVGTAANNYLNGKAPSANIIIYGHNIVHYKMFGALKQFFSSKAYIDGKTFLQEHHTFTFTTCYEEREYEIIALFEDKIPEDNSYYFASYVNCYSQADFDKWYSYIKKKSVKKLNVTAEYGDEFITLVTCSRNGDTPYRHVVVAKRTK